MPFGGFVRIDGEDFSKPSAFADGAFMSKSLPKRLLVLVAGVVMNLVLAWAIFTGMFLVGAKPLTVIPMDIGPTHSFFLPSFEESLESGFIKRSNVTIEPLEDSIAQKSGLRENDEIISVNGQKIVDTDDLVEIIAKNKNLDFEILRDGEIQKIAVRPENGKIGTKIFYKSLELNQDFSKKTGIIDAMQLGAGETYHTSMLTFKLVKKTLGALFFPKDDAERTAAQKNLSGPIGMGNAFVMMVEQALPISVILLFVALLSINLAVMNILPFPALDGGRMLFTTLYSIGKTLGFSREKILKGEQIINSLGFILLLIFMIYVAGIDIFRLLQ